jgi:hypothetical protein
MSYLVMSCLLYLLALSVPARRALRGTARGFSIAVVCQIIVVGIRIVARGPRCTCLHMQDMPRWDEEERQGGGEKKVGGVEVGGKVRERRCSSVPS